MAVLFNTVYLPPAPLRRLADTVRRQINANCWAATCSVVLNAAMNTLPIFKSALVASLTMSLAMSCYASSMATTPELLTMWRSGEQAKMAYVIGYVAGVLDNLTGDDGVCLERAVGKTIPEIAASIMRQTEADLARRLANIKKVEKASGAKAPSLGASMDVVISARQIYKCGQP